MASSSGARAICHPYPSPINAKMLSGFDSTVMSLKADPTRSWNLDPSSMERKVKNIPRIVHPFFFVRTAKEKAVRPTSNVCIVENQLASESSRVMLKNLSRVSLPSNSISLRKMSARPISSAVPTRAAAVMVRVFLMLILMFIFFDYLS